MGIAMVYTSESVALATLEKFIHMEPSPTYDDYIVFKVEIEPSLIKIPSTLPPGWNNKEVISASQEFGDVWYHDNETPALKVPSRLIQNEYNYLINPEHPLFSSIQIHPAEDYTFDERLLDFLKALAS